MPSQDWKSHRRTQNEVSDISVAKAFLIVVFDKDKTQEGRESLAALLRQWDDKNKVFLCDQQGL